MATSEARILANRENALKSTGPRAAEGKARAAMNAVKHGLCAASVVAPGADTESFELIRDQLMKEYSPRSVVEVVLVTQLAQAAWRMSRLAGAEAKAIEHAMSGTRLDAAGALTRDITRINSSLNRLQIYQMRQERAFYRALAELRKVRKEFEECEEAVVEEVEQTKPTEAVTDEQARTLDDSDEPDMPLDVDPSPCDQADAIAEGDGDAIVEQTNPMTASIASTIDAIDDASPLPSPPPAYDSTELAEVRVRGPEKLENQNNSAPAYSRDSLSCVLTGEG